MGDILKADRRKIRVAAFFAICGQLSYTLYMPSESYFSKVFKSNN
ncbi:MAG: hypothetical protein QW395_05900 [Candidatus Nitrosotenuis sp.]